MIIYTPTSTPTNNKTINNMLFHSYTAIYIKKKTKRANCYRKRKGKGTNKGNRKRGNPKARRDFTKPQKPTFPFNIKQRFPCQSFS